VKFPVPEKLSRCAQCKRNLFVGFVHQFGLEEVSDQCIAFSNGVGIFIVFYKADALEVKQQFPVPGSIAVVFLSGGGKEKEKGDKE